MATAVVTSAMLRTCPVRLAAMPLTLSVRSFQVPPTPLTSAWPPSLPSVPTSRATRVTSEANELSWSTMTLIVFFSSRISPLASTVIFRVRSPLATAVVTLAMLRTCPVRLAAMPLTFSVRSFQVPPTPLTSAWPPSLPSVPTSRATRVTSEANELSWSTMTLIVFFSSRISPLASTVILRERSPVATAVVTLAMLRTWPVRLAAMPLTLSVRSFQVPATPLTSAWPPSLPSEPTSRATRVTSEANELSWSTMTLMVFFSSRISPLALAVIFFDRSPRATAVVTSAMLRTWPVRLAAMPLTFSVRSFQVPATPWTSAWPPSLPSEPTSRATRVTSEANELSWSTMTLIVFFSSRISPLASTVIFFDRSPLSDGGGDIGDVADLAGEVGGHAVDVVGEVLPGAADALDVGLAAQLALRAHLAGHAADFRGERVELVHHDVDRVLQLEDLPLGVDGDLLRQVAASDGGGDIGDVADLPGEVGGHAVDVVGEVLPGAADALDVGLAAQLALRADLACHAADFRGERVELVHHDVDGVLQLQDLPLGIDGDLSGEVARGDRGGDGGDIADLSGEVGGHEIDALGEVLPGAADALDVGLAAQLALRAHLACHAGHFRGERAELVHHAVDRIPQPEELALEGPAVRLELHPLRQVAFGDGTDHARHLRRRPDQVTDELVERFDPDRPSSGGAGQAGTLSDLAFRADHLADSVHLIRGPLQELHEVVESHGELSGDPGLVQRQPAGKVALAGRSEDAQQTSSVEVVACGGKVSGHTRVSRRICRGVSRNGQTGVRHLNMMIERGFDRRRAARSNPAPRSRCQVEHARWTSMGSSSTSKISTSAGVGFVVIIRSPGSRQAGMVKQNVAPFPSSESTQSRPPWRSIAFLQIARPIPVPG